jgi:uncharacterized membrane protein
MFEDLFIYLARNFVKGEYIKLTVFQGLLWSAADIFLVFCLLRVRDVVQSSGSQASARLRYILLGFSALLTPLLFFCRQSGTFFFMESVIFGLQYGILIYTLVRDSSSILAELKEHIS